MGQPVPTSLYEYGFEDGTRLQYTDWQNISSGIAIMVQGSGVGPFAIYYVKLMFTTLPGAGTANINIAVAAGDKTRLGILITSIVGGTSQQILSPEWQSPRLPAGLVVPNGGLLIIQSAYGGVDLSVRTLVAYRPLTRRL